MNQTCKTEYNPIYLATLFYLISVHISDSNILRINYKILILWAHLSINLVKHKTICVTEQNNINVVADIILSIIYFVVLLLSRNFAVFNDFCEIFVHGNVKSPFLLPSCHILFLSNVQMKIMMLPWYFTI